MVARDRRFEGGSLSRHASQDPLVARILRISWVPALGKRPDAVDAGGTPTELIEVGSVSSHLQLGLGVTPRLELRISPQLVLSTRMLALSTVDLLGVVEEELAEN